MKVAVVGGRNINIDISQYMPKNVSQIISGGASGIDSCAAEYARKNNIELIEFLPDWQKYGKKAGPIRNTKIIEAADYVLAIWDGKSPGTKDSIKKAKALKKEYRVIIKTPPAVPIITYPTGILSSGSLLLT